MAFISTGLLGLDEMLGGGISAGTITDISGPGGSGKTQLAMQISLNSLQQSRVLYQDTSGGFRPERMLQMIQVRGLEPSLLDDVIVARITNTAEQLEYLKKISVMQPRLVVIENITDLFSFEYSKESSMLEKHVQFIKYMHELSFLAVQNKIAVVVTNVVRNMEGREVENLNNSISMFVHKKIKLQKDGKKYRAQVLPSFGEKKEILYTITQSGIEAP